MRILVIGDGFDLAKEQWPEAGIDTCKLNKVKSMPGLYDRVFSLNQLQMVYRQDIVDTLKLWGSKLKEGGELHLFAPSFEWAAKHAILSNKLPLLFSHHLEGDKDNPKRSIHLARQLRVDMEDAGLRVTSARVGLYTKLVEGEECAAGQHYMIARRKIGQRIVLPKKSNKPLTDELLILDPSKCDPLPIESGGWNYVLDYYWLVEQVINHGGKKILDVGSLYSNLDFFLKEYLGVEIRTVERNQSIGADYSCDFSDLPDDGFIPDIIMWASSIEHNSIEDIRRYYLESMGRLKKGGLFIATFAISQKTAWHEATKQTNLSMEDAKKVFDMEAIQGNLAEIKKMYQDNVHSLRSNYRSIFGKFDASDPEYVVGAVRKVKR